MRCDGILLYVSEVQRSLDFYGFVLGLPTYRVDEHFAIVHIGDFSIYLHEQPCPLPEHLAALGTSSYRGVGTILHLRHESVDACAEKVRACGYQISCGPIDQTFGRRQMYLYDPDGYNIVVEQAIALPET